MLPGRWWQRSAPTWRHFPPRMIWRAGWESVPGTTRAPGNERAERLTEQTAALGEPYAKPRPVTARHANLTQNARTLSEVPRRENAEGASERSTGALSIRAFEGSRWRLRRTRSAMGFQ